MGEGRGMDFDLMPPPGSSKKAAVSMDVEQMIDPNEPTYCICHQVSYGDMIACDNENCEGGEWFHYSCVGLTPKRDSKGNGFAQLAGIFNEVLLNCVEEANGSTNWPDVRQHAGLFNMMFSEVCSIVYQMITSFRFERRRYE
ncbi:hypothetical protein QYE76_061869 [Lolium multiflorum]|uniref:Zinc finger PHD-type domain-containing protein n=1 Tax=Lolium multiflorum TaxID=4521 RepID=A0AAD8S2G2_LOLMU|nr:hypothetical protein QYE76_061869 [Lolium multiflorum]